MDEFPGGLSTYARSNTLTAILPTLVRKSTQPKSSCCNSLAEIVGNYTIRVLYAIPSINQAVLQEGGPPPQETQYKIVLVDVLHIYKPQQILATRAWQSNKAPALVAYHITSYIHALHHVDVMLEVGEVHTLWVESLPR